MSHGQRVLSVTERCLLRLTDQVLDLVAVAPGVDVGRDVLAHMAVRPVVSDDLCTMEAAIFRDRPMGRRDRPQVGLDERFRFDRATDTVHVNVEGLRLLTVQDADDLAAELGPRFADLGQRVHAVVNQANFYLGPDGAHTFFAMVRRNEERFFLPTTHYSTSAVFRRQFGRESNDRDIDANFGEDRR